MYNMSNDHQNDHHHLKCSYVKSLPKKIAQINSIWTKLCSINWNDDAFSILDKEVKKLATAGERFDLFELNKQAQLLDNILTGIHDEHRLPTGVERNDIYVKFRQLINISNAMPPLDGDSHINSLNGLNQKNQLIYIIDSDYNAGELTSLILRNEGYLTSAFHSISAFYRAFEQQQPDAIIMDVVFPEGSLAGIESIQYAQNKWKTQVPILFTSARTDIAARLKALRVGGAYYLPKPVKTQELVSSLAEVLEDKPMPAKVLIVSTDKCTLKYLTSLLKHNGMDAISTSDPYHVIYQIELFKPDIVLAEQNTTEFSSYELAALLHQDRRYASLPLIIIAEGTAANTRRDLLSLGTTNLIYKPIDEADLIGVITRSLCQAETAKRLLSTTKQCQQNLVDSQFFFTEFSRIIATVTPDEKPYTLAYIAIDNTDYLRSLIGFNEMSNLNLKIIEQIKLMLQRNELMTQLNEFVYLVLFRLSEPENLIDYINHIALQLSQSKFYQDFGPPIGVTASIGCFNISARTMSVSDAIDTAQGMAMKAQKKGGNQMCLGLPNTQATLELDQDHDIGKLVLSAFKNDTLHLHYQPIINLDMPEGVFVGYARLYDKNNIILPTQFMPYVHENHMEDEFNRRITQLALDDLINASAEVSEETDIIVKLEPSGKPLTSLLPWLSNLVTHSRVRGEGRFIFAFNEKAILSNASNCREFIKQSQCLKCRFSMEHAGSSSHTLEIVKSIQPRYVHLSPQFIHDILAGKSKDQHDLLEALLKTNSRVVACAIEEATSFAKLWDLGLRFFQGNFVKEPEADLNFDFKHTHLQ